MSENDDDIQRQIESGEWKNAPVVEAEPPLTEPQKPIADYIPQPEPPPKKNDLIDAISRELDVLRGPKPPGIMQTPEEVEQEVEDYTAGMGFPQIELGASRLLWGQLKDKPVSKALGAMATMEDLDLALAVGGSPKEAIRLTKGWEVEQDVIEFYRMMLHGINPDDEVQIQHMAMQKGVPPEAIRERFNEIKQDKNLARLIALLNERKGDGTAKYPQTVRFLQTPDNFRVAFDDVETLAALETAIVDAYGSRLQKYGYSFKTGSKLFAGGLVQTAKDATEVLFNLSQPWGQPPAISDERLQAELRQSFGDDIKYLLAPRELKTGGFVADVIGVAPQIIGTTAAYIAHPAAAAATFMSYAQGLGSAQLQAEGMSLWERLPYSVAMAGGETALEMAQFKLFAKPFLRMLHLDGKPFRTFMWGTLRMAGTAQIEMPQNVWTDLISRAALSQSSDEFFDGLTGYIGRSAVQGFYEGLVMTPYSMLFGATGIGRDVRMAKLRAPLLKAYDDVMDVAARSELRIRDPIRYETEFAARLVERLPSDEVAVSREAWEEHFEATPEEGQELAKKLGIESQVAEGKSGPELHVAAAKWFTYMPGPHGKALREHMRFAVTDVTEAEFLAQKNKIDRWLAEAQEDIDAALSEAEELTPEEKAVVKAVRDSGFNKEVAEEFVRLVQIFGARMAPKAGLLPAQWWKENAPLVERMELAALLKARKEAEEAGVKLPELPKDATLRGVYLPHRRLIALLEKGDHRTLVHELYHFFLGQMRGMRGKDAEIDSILDALEEGKFGTEESQANEFTRYLQKGVAPSRKLITTFAKFRTWLMALYRQVRQEVAQDAELRGVFDRMLASEEEIDATRAEMRSRTEAEEEWRKLIDEADLPPARKAEIKGIMDAANEKTRSKRAARLIAAFRSVNKSKKEIVADIEKEVAKDEFYQLLQGIREEAPIDRDSLKAQVGEKPTREIEEKFPGVVKQKDGWQLAHVAARAEMSVDDLVQALRDNPAFDDRVRQLLAERLAALEQQFVDEAGQDPIIDLLYSDSMAVAAEQHAVIVKHAQALMKKIAVRAEKATEAAEKEEAKEARKDAAESAAALRKPNITAVKRMAREDIRALSVRAGTSVRRFVFAAGRASQKAIDAVRKGDWFDALKWKHLEIYHLALAIEAHRRSKQVAAQKLQLAKLRTRPNVHPLFHAQVIALQQQFGLTKKRVPKGTPTLHRFLQTLRDAKDDTGAEYGLGGVEGVPDIGQWDWMVRGEQSYRDLSIEEWEATHWLAHWLSGAGLVQAQKVQLERAMTIHEAAEQCAQPMATLRDIYVPQEESISHRVRTDMRRREAEKTTLQHIAIRSDAYSNVEPNLVVGPNEGGWYLGLHRAMTHEENLIREFQSKYGKGIHQQFVERALESNRDRGHAFDIPGVPTSRNEAHAAKMKALGRNRWTWERWFMALVNTGNRGNLRALMSGYGFTAEDVTAIRSFATKAEMELAQAIWDSNEYWYEHVNNAYKDQYLIDLERVEAEPFEVRTSDGHYMQMRGGYHPLITDSSLDESFRGDEELDLLKQLNQVIHQEPVPERDFTIPRQGSRHPPLLNLNVVTRHWLHAAHYATHARVLREADLLTTDPVWRDMFLIKHGEQMYRKIRAHLNAIAKPQVHPYDSTEKWFELCRRQAISYMLVLNTRAIIPQPVAAINSIRSLGVGRWLKAMGRPLGQLATGQWRQWHLDRVRAWQEEPSLQMRISSIEREASRGLAGLEDFTFWTGISRIRLKASEFRWWLSHIFGWADSLVVLPIYEAHKQRFKDDHVHEYQDPNALHQAAVDYAALRISAEHPVLTPLTSTWFQRQKGMRQIVNFFLTPGMLYFNRSRAHFNAYRNGKIGLHSLLAHITFEHLLQPLAFGTVQHILATGELPDWEDSAEAIASWWLLPRPVLAMILGFYAVNTPLLMPAKGMHEAAAKLKTVITDVTDAENWLKLLWAGATVGDMISGVPASKIVKTALEGMEEIQEGDANIIRMLAAPIVRKDYKHKHRGVAHYQ